MSDNSLNNKRIAKNTAFLYVRMIFVLGVSLYTTRVVLNVLGVEDYGIYNVVAGFVSMFAFLNSAMINTTQRFYNYEKSSSEGNALTIVYNTALQIQVLLAILLLILLETVGLWFVNNQMIIPVERLAAANWVFQCSGLSLVLLVLQIPYSAAIISHEKMDYYALVSIIDVFLKLVVVIVLPYVSYDKLAFYGITSVLVSLMDFLMYFYYAKRYFIEIRFNRVFVKDKFKEMLSFTGWNVFSSFAYMIQGQGLNVLINTFFGPVVNAARGVSFQIQGAISGFSENIATAFRPQLVSSYAESNFDRTRNLMFSMSKFCFVMVCALSIPIAIELEYILEIWLKSVVPEYTIIFTVLVLVNMIINSLNMPISQTVLATGIVKSYQLIRSIIVTATLPLAWIVLKTGASPVSVFVITILISILNQPVSMIILRKNFTYSYRDYFKVVIVPCSLFLVLNFAIPYIIHTFMEPSFLRFCIVGGISGFMSLILAYMLILSKAEKSTIVNLINSKRNVTR